MNRATRLYLATLLICGPGLFIMEVFVTPQMSAIAIEALEIDQ